MTDLCDFFPAAASAAHELRQRQPADAEAADLEERPARQAVAVADGSENGEHQRKLVSGGGRALGRVSRVSGVCSGPSNAPEADPCPEGTTHLGLRRL